MRIKGRSNVRPVLQRGALRFGNDDRDIWIISTLKPWFSRLFLIEFLKVLQQVRKGFADGMNRGNILRLLEKRKNIQKMAVTIGTAIFLV